MAAGLEQAMELIRRQRYSEAIERLRAGLSDTPDDPAMRALCGEAYHRSGNQERAFHHYNKAAAIYIHRGDAESALKMLKLANSMSPNEPDILFRTAECLKALGEVRELDTTLRQLIQVAKATGDRRRLWALDELSLRYPDDLELGTMRADAMIEIGRVAEGAALWRTLVQQMTSPIDFMPKATSLVALAPKDPAVGVEVAATLLQSGRAREAILILAPYYEQFPEHIRILEILPEALEAIGAKDKLVAARLELLKARTRHGQKDLGIQEITRLIGIAPEDIEVLEIAAHAYTAFSEVSEATAIWRRLVEIYGRMGRKADRDRAVLNVLTVDPDDEDALAAGARSLREGGRNAEAQEFENRLAAIRRRRNPSPPRKPVAPRKPEPPAPPARRDPSGATLYLDEPDFEEIRELSGPEQEPPAQRAKVEPSASRALEPRPTKADRPLKEPPPPARGYADDLFLEENTSRLSSPRVSTAPMPSVEHDPFYEPSTETRRSPSNRSPSAQQARDLVARRPARAEAIHRRPSPGDLLEVEDSRRLRDPAMHATSPDEDDTHKVETLEAYDQSEPVTNVVAVTVSPEFGDAAAPTVLAQPKILAPSRLPAEPAHIETFPHPFEAVTRPRVVDLSGDPKDTLPNDDSGKSGRTA